MFWITLAAVVYVVLLACVLVFFAGVGKVNEHCEQVEQEALRRLRQDEHVRRAA